MRIRSAIVVALLFLTGCAGWDLDRARSRFYRGDVRGAAEAIEERAEEDRKDGVLFREEAGAIFQALGEYEKSNRFLIRAAEEIEALTRKSISREGASLWYNDDILEYRGEMHEHFLVHTMAMMNFLALGEPEGALVEARRAVKKLESDIYPDHVKDPYTRYLAAVAYDIRGADNDAYIEYKKVAEQVPGCPWLKEPLLRLGSRLGKSEDRARWESLPDPPAAPEEGEGELLLMIGIGRSPVKWTERYYIPPYYVLPIPKFQTRDDPVRYASVSSSGGREIRSVRMADVERIAVKTLDDRMKKIVAKELIRQGVNEAAVRVTQKQIDDEHPGAGFAAGLGMRILYILIRHADTRSWQTLPREFHILRLPLPAGDQSVELRFHDSNGNIVSTQSLSPVQIHEEGLTFLPVRYIHTVW